MENIYQQEMTRMGVLYNHPAAEEGNHQDVLHNTQAGVPQTHQIKERSSVLIIRISNFTYKSTS